MQRLFSLVLIAAMLFPLAGCDEDAVITNAYKIIRTAGTVYDAGMRASADAYASGKLSPEQYLEIKESAKVYYETYHAARMALSAYYDTRGEEQRKKLDSSVDAMKANLGRFCAVAWKFGVTLNGEKEQWQ